MVQTGQNGVIIMRRLSFIYKPALIVAGGILFVLALFFIIHNADIRIFTKENEVLIAEFENSRLELEEYYKGADLSSIQNMEHVESAAINVSYALLYKNTYNFNVELNIHFDDKFRNLDIIDRCEIVLNVFNSIDKQLSAFDATYKLSKFQSLYEDITEKKLLDNKGVFGIYYYSSYKMWDGSHYYEIYKGKEDKEKDELLLRDANGYIALIYNYIVEDDHVVEIDNGKKYTGYSPSTGGGVSGSKNSSSDSKGSSSGGGKKSSDPYDVHDYDSADDFADDKYEEFYDYEDDYEDEDEAYDAAEDYWNDEY